MARGVDDAGVTKHVHDKRTPVLLTVGFRTIKPVACVISTSPTEERWRIQQCPTLIKRQATNNA